MNDDYGAILVGYANALNEKVEKGTLSNEKCQRCLLKLQEWLDKYVAERKIIF